MITKKLFYVSVKYFIQDRLGDQLNLPKVSQSIEFGIRSSVELTNDLIISLAKNLVDDREAYGFTFKSMCTLSERFFSDNDNPTIVDFEFLETDEKPTDDM